MNVKTAKIIRIILLVVACIACIVGVSTSQRKAKEAATDVSKIKVEITDKSSYSDNQFNVKYTFSIKNGTKVDWSYLKITTYVYDKNGKELGTLTSELGNSYNSSNFKSEAGKTISKDVTFSSSYPDDFFTKLYESDFTDLKYESVVTYGTYLKN